MKSKHLLMSVAAAALSAASLFVPVTAAHAQQAEVGSIAYLPPLALTEVEPAAGGDTKTVAPEDNRRGWARYFEYEHREECQHYVEPPQGWVMIGCHLQREQQVSVAAPATVAAIEPAAGGPVLPIEPEKQTLYFDFDHDEIRADQQAAVSKTASDIKMMHPAIVTVAGYADAAGPDDYNDGLSARRAQSVTDALTSQGVKPALIDQKSYGEHNLAVPTADGVRMQENRRVTVEFTPSAPPNEAAPGM